MAKKDDTASVSPITGDVGRMRVMAEAIIGRAATAAMAGQSYGGQRDLYKALGYKTAIEFKDYDNRYRRQDVAKRIINAPVNATWRKKPAINENLEGQPGDSTEFEKAWDTMVKDLRVYHYLQRADKISGIGQFGVLLLGFDGEGELSDPVDNGAGRELLYLMPYSQGSVTVKTWQKDTSDSRYSLPETYEVKMIMPGEQGSSKTTLVHWSRIVHIAEELLENDVFGTPRLEAIFNRLQDLDLIAGGSAEMFWRGAFPGYALKADPDYEFTATDMEDLEEEVTKFVHDLQRYVRMVGVNMEALEQQVADPKNHFDILMSLISATTGIPKRILMGSERGELASSMDENNWNTRVDERRTDHAELMILRPFVDRLVDVGALPPPGADGYTVEWEDISVPTEKDEAEVARLKAEALAKYAGTAGMDMLMPWSVFLSRIMGFGDDEIEQMEKALKEDELDAEVIEAETAAQRAALEQEMRDAGWTAPLSLPAPDAPVIPPPPEEE